MSDEIEGATISNTGLVGNLEEQAIRLINYNKLMCAQDEYSFNIPTKYVDDYLVDKVLKCEPPIRGIILSIKVNTVEVGGEDAVVTATPYELDLSVLEVSGFPISEILDVSGLGIIK